MSRAHDGAERKGREARQAGLGPDACPYRDLRKPDGRITGSRGFRNAWRMGWMLADLELRQTEREGR